MCPLSVLTPCPFSAILTILTPDWGGFIEMWTYRTMESSMVIGSRLHRMKPLICVLILGGEDVAALLRLLGDIEKNGQGLRLTVIVVNNHHIGYTPVQKKLREHGWLYYQTPEKFSGDKAFWWTCEIANSQIAHSYIHLTSDIHLHPDIFTIASATWTLLSIPDRSVLVLTGSGHRPLDEISDLPESVWPSKVLGGCFMMGRPGIECLAKGATGKTAYHAMYTQGFRFYQVGRSLVGPHFEPKPPPRPKPKPLLKEKIPEEEPASKPIAQKEVRFTPKGGKKAAFFVATHYRPELLRFCLRRLVTQQVPDGWQIEILVCGMADDPGRNTVREFPGVRFIESKGSSVTYKLNILLEQTDARLVMLADDDDLQPLGRAAAAIAAHENGHNWSGTGTIRFYDIDHDRVMKWSGNASRGMVGTSLSYDTVILRQVNGWPERKKGKDGPLARKIQTLPTANFADLTPQLEGTVCLQHKANLWKRPILERGAITTKGGFHISGEGTLLRSSVAEVGGILGMTSAIIHIIITTHNRPRDALRLLRDIDTGRGAHDIRVFVYDDASTADYEPVRAFLESRGWHYRREGQNQGKQGYYKIVTRTLQDAKHSGAAYYYFLQDDIRLCHRFFARTMDIWQGISDEMKGALYLLKDTTWPNARWTKQKPVHKGSVELTGWVDCAAFMFQEQLLDALRCRIVRPSDAWFANPKLSSGVGRFITRSLQRRKFTMYRATQSMVVHVQTPSLMNPSARDKTRMYTVDYIDGDDRARRFETYDAITASVASIPSRTHCLEQVVAQILPQVDYLNVYLNGYERVPDFLDHPRIQVAQSQKTDFGDRGDAGKFYWTSEVDGYHFTIDDDIFYPANYVDLLIQCIERHQRKAVVGVHGATLTPPIKDYYRSRRIHHFTQKLPQDTPVHVLGTGTVAYHTSTIRVDRLEFRHPNMADIWFALSGQHQQVPFICMTRDNKWLTSLPDTDTESIYMHSRRGHDSKQNTMTMQTRIVKSHHTWRLHQVGQT